LPCIGNIGDPLSPALLLENFISGSGIRPLTRGPSGRRAEATLEDAPRPPVRETASKTAKKGAERYPSVHKAACGGLFRIAAGLPGPTLVSNLIMILLSSHSPG